MESELQRPAAASNPDGQDNADADALQAQDTLQEANQLDLLRRLLAVERKRNEQRRLNNNGLKKYLKQLQAEYLQCQRELVEGLELANKVKGHKEAQLASLEATLAEKERLIGQLQAALDGSRLKQEFDESLLLQKRASQMERDQISSQINSLQQQLVSERIANSELLQEFQTKLDNTTRDHQSECSRFQDKIQKLETDLDELLNTSENLTIKLLKEEKSNLLGQVDDLNLVLNQSQLKYDNLRKSLENLLSEQEQLEQKNLEAIVKLQEQQSDQRAYLSELKMALEDKEEVAQILQFNLQRSEKRVKNLLGALKGKESTYKEMVEQLHLKHSDELDQKASQIGSLERKLVELEVESDKRQNEIVRLGLQHENQLDSIKSDRDERICRLQEERDKFERALREMEIQFGQAMESGKCEGKQAQQSLIEAEEFKEENQRLLLEASGWKAKAERKQADLDELLKKFENHCQEFNCNRLKLELEEASNKLAKSEEIMEDLRKDNSKLYMKVKLHEASMGKVSEAIKKEHAKMVRDYEQRLLQIQAEQNACDQNRIRYKRYGTRLKRHLEHLREAHRHICKPSTCGGPQQTERVSEDDQSSSTAKLEQQ